MLRVGEDEVQLEKSVRRLREKFHGKVISIEKAVALMRKFTNNHDMVCRYIILLKECIEDLEPDEVETLQMDQAAKRVVEKLKLEEEQKKIAKDIVKDKDIQEIVKKALTEKNLRIFNKANKNCIPYIDKQFACRLCDNMWWRRVPERKQVSKCRKCRQKYDPVPLDKMWGFAEFSCPSCLRMFRGFTQMGAPCPCYICNTSVLPSHILPPRRTPGPRGRNPHSCFAEDCYNRREPHLPGTHCMHPRSRAKNNLPKVLHPSPIHESTDSTVATCISQGSLDICDIEDLILEDLKESAEEEDEEDNAEDSDD
ncbi:shiftless antiviral inhibitor of ribosomal frameshifting protein [Ambystoma mexicanum]|uniref:shiftless antiviral inhibitor of ribosomal frameshifting protein n=1 Tax=Ambystoma mexicanum TaxID=8296 RepID=UPI0037E7B207